MKKLISILLVSAMLVSMIACGGTTTSTPTPTPTPAQEGGTATPAEPAPVTFNLMKMDLGSGVNPADLPIVKDYTAKNAEKKVELTWTSIGNVSEMAEKINILFSSGTQGDAIFSNALTESDVSRLSAQKLLVPLEDYITKENTPNIYALFEKEPSTKAVSTLPDGHIYTLPRFYGNSGDFLESPIWINKTWLDKLNLTVPTTTDELYNVLLAFKTKDPNENGKPDEIPYLMRNGDSMAHPEALLGIWGLPTKDNAFDSFITVSDGNVLFAPTTNEYKEGILYLNKLYKEGLIYQDAFTCTPETFIAKQNPEIPTYGMMTGKTIPKFSEEYVQILPPKATGYEPNWFYHPGSLGIKNFFAITNKCSDPARLLNFIDGWFETEQTLINCYGSIGEVLIKDDKGVLSVQKPPSGVSLTEYQIYNTLSNVPHFVVYKEDFGTKFAMSDNDKAMMKSYELYKNVITDEIWPRPFLTPESVSRASELRTDIFNTVSQTKAKWVTGQADINADWDKYLTDIQKMGIDEFIKLYQEAYDIYINASK